MTDNRLRFIPECYADTELIAFLAGSAATVDHALNISQVASEMKKVSQNDTIEDFTLIGLVDNDKYKPPYFTDFQEFDRGQRVSFRHKADTHQYLMVLEKAIETFLLHNAAAVGLNMSDFGFSDNLKELKHQLKRMTIGSNADYLRLLTELQQKQAPDFVKIIAFLSKFINKQ
jgi:hypothetical protein